MILPVVRETVVSAISAEQINENLKKVVRQGRRESWLPGEYLFMGKLRENHFDITRILNRPENFMPQIQGRIEPTSTGSILFLRYTLQFSSRMFVIFWTICALSFSFFLWFIQTNMFLGLMAMVALIANLAVTHINFRRYMKQSRDTLLEAINK